MKLQYDDWMKEVIAGGVREVMEGNSPVYEVPENILFREIEYTPQGILAEVQNRTEVGEMILQEIYTKRNKIEEGLEGFLKNPDDAFCDVQVGKAPTYRETYERITKAIENKTDSGKAVLQPYFEACVGDLFSLPERASHLEWRDRFQGKKK